MVAPVSQLASCGATHVPWLLGGGDIRCVETSGVSQAAKTLRQCGHPLCPAEPHLLRGGQSARNSPDLKFTGFCAARMSDFRHFRLAAISLPGLG